MTKDEKENMYFKGFFKYDLANQEIVKKIYYGDSRWAGEVTFQKREGSTAEDDGYLMTTVFDHFSKLSEFCVWDAKTLESVVRIQLNDRVPNGFHNLFVAEEDLD